jgi:putative addiction module killer protein
MKKYSINQTENFVNWKNSLKDLKAKAAILRRIDRAEHGNLGDIKPVGGAVSEMRIDVGAGYRLYFTIRSSEILILLVGGDKSTQAKDIEKAIKLAKDLQP